jgi:hypothetical protein
MGVAAELVAVESYLAFMPVSWVQVIYRRQEPEFMAIVDSIVKRRLVASAASWGREVKEVMDVLLVHAREYLARSPAQRRSTP